MTFKNKSDLKYAFTLAEVLITLVIVGVIAAMTIPTLINKTQKQEFVSGLKKAYSNLSTVTNKIIAEEGVPRADIGGWASSAENIYKLYKSRLSVAKDCGNGRGCVDQLSSVSGGFNGLYVKPSLNNYEKDTAFYKLILSDGVQLIFDDYISSQQTCSQSERGSTNMCYALFVDVNGEKGPNAWGKDVYFFALKENGLFPGGCDDASQAQCYKNGHGVGCACKALRENAINYY